MDGMAKADAAELARAQDLHDFQVSISHEAHVAIAMVIATRSGARIEKKDDIADD
jgi:holo-[acyl-carrier protein] synthase